VGSKQNLNTVEQNEHYVQTGHEANYTSSITSYPVILVTRRVSLIMPHAIIINLAVDIENPACY
jgi:hypothetical protein